MYPVTQSKSKKIITRSMCVISLIVFIWVIKVPTKNDIGVLRFAKRKVCFYEYETQMV